MSYGELMSGGSNVLDSPTMSFMSMVISFIILCTSSSATMSICLKTNKRREDRGTFCLHFTKESSSMLCCDLSDKISDLLVRTKRLITWMIGFGDYTVVSMIMPVLEITTSFQLVVTPISTRPISFSRLSNTAQVFFGLTKN